MATLLPGDVRRFDDVTPEAVLAAARVLGVPRSPAQRVVRDVVTRTFRHFDRVYARHFPGEPGLMSDPVADTGAAAPAPTAAHAVDDAAGHASPAQQLAAERRLLRLLRYVVLPEMRARIVPARP